MYYGRDNIELFIYSDRDMKSHGGGGILAKTPPSKIKLLDAFVFSSSDLLARG